MHNFRQEISDPLHDISLAISKSPLSPTSDQHKSSDGTEIVSANKISILEAIKSHQLYEQSLNASIEHSYVEGVNFQTNMADVADAVTTQRAISRNDSQISRRKSSTNNSDNAVNEFL